VTQKIEALLSQIVSSDIARETWMTGINTVFGMSPAAMVMAGREEEVINYLKYQIEGPY
jgi:hypothetical protein